MFQWLFGRGSAPTLGKSDSADALKARKLVQWFIGHDHMVQPIASISCNRIYAEGVRPAYLVLGKPADLGGNQSSLTEWFHHRMAWDVAYAGSLDKSELQSFIDVLDGQGAETMAAAGRISVKYGLSAPGDRLNAYYQQLGRGRISVTNGQNALNSAYDREVAKIPEAAERDNFKLMYLSDTVLGAEIRILAWLFHGFHGDWYKIPEDRPIATTDWDKAGALQRQCPETLAALTYLVPALKDAWDRGARHGPFDLEGTTGELEAAFRGTVLAMVLDGLVQPDAQSPAIRDRLAGIIQLFAAAFPNWQGAYALSHAFLIESPDTADRYIGGLMQSSREHP